MSGALSKQPTDTNVVARKAKRPPRTHAKYMALIHRGADFTHPANVMTRLAEQLERELEAMEKTNAMLADNWTNTERLLVHCNARLVKTSQALLIAEEELAFDEEHTVIKGTDTPRLVSNALAIVRAALKG